MTIIPKSYSQILVCHNLVPILLFIPNPVAHNFFLLFCYVFFRHLSTRGTSKYNQQGEITNVQQLTWFLWKAVSFIPEETSSLDFPEKHLTLPIVSTQLVAILPVKAILCQRTLWTQASPKIEPHGVRTRRVVINALFEFRFDPGAVNHSSHLRQGEQSYEHQADVCLHGCVCISGTLSEETKKRYFMYVSAYDEQYVVIMSVFICWMYLNISFQWPHL